MNAEIWTAVLALIGTAIGTIGGMMAAARLTAYRLQELEKKVDKHNHVIERMTIVENEIQRIDEKYDEKIADLKKARAI